MTQTPWFWLMLRCGGGGLALFLALTLAGTLPAAELLPFPAPAQPAPYQQQAPLPGRPSGEFRSEFARLPCPELQDLITRIQEQASRATDAGDREYYLRILMDLKRESAARCQP